MSERDAEADLALCEAARQLEREEAMRDGE